MNRFFVLLFTLMCISVQGQTCISGFVKFKQANQRAQKILLVADPHQDLQKPARILASAAVDRTGYFEIEVDDHAYFDPHFKFLMDRIDYLDDQLTLEAEDYQVFLIADKDTVPLWAPTFLAGENLANGHFLIEWKNLQLFRESLTSFDSSTYLEHLREYQQDSIRGMLVKLSGIKALDEEGLLEKDIQQHPQYYIKLLRELNESSLDPAYFHFLAAKSTLALHDVVEQKYHYSMIFNGFSVVALLLLGLYHMFIRRRKNVPMTYSLSDQESTIHDLVMAGKSNKEIAQELLISVSTVKSHLTSLYKKLGVTGRKELRKIM